MEKYLVDTHTHIDMEEDFPDLEEVILRAHNAGVNEIIIPSCTVDSFERVIEIAHNHEGVYCALGIHPTEFKDVKDSDFEKIIELSSDSKVVAIGECGLDYYWDKDSERIKKQIEVFTRQIKIANKIKKPLLVHARDAVQESFNLLKDSLGKDVKVVMHCFSGSTEAARQCLNRGYYLGFGGALTFKNSKKAKEIVKTMPLDRLLLETDAPYMTPVPHRGERNEPMYVRNVAEYVAELRGITVDEVAKQTRENVKEVFGF
jgi:TatD DNase family protein